MRCCPTLIRRRKLGGEILAHEVEEEKVDETEYEEDDGLGVEITAETAAKIATVVGMAVEVR